jgi:glycosyltransferase involved in cell wall biosynthesis
MTLVSILVPAYNGERHLAAALDSALAQTHRDLEILVGDDGSTDSTLQIARAYAARDPRVRVLESERNRGAAANQVRLHHAAKSAFVKPLLQDDVLRPRAVERLLAPLWANAEVMLSTSKRALIDGDGEPLAELPWTRALVAHDAILDGTAVGDAMLCGTVNLIGEVTTAMYRAHTVAPDDLWHLGGEEFRANADIVLWLKLLAGARLAYAPDELSAFRQHDAQASQRPEVILGGQLEWARMALEATRFGYLQRPEQEHAALVRAAQIGGQALPALGGRPADLAALTSWLGQVLRRIEQLQALQARLDAAFAA